MADQDNYKTYVRETRTTESTGSGTAIIIGGLIVAVGFILWFIFGAFVPADRPAVENDTTNVTIEPATPAAPATDVAPADPVAPATDAAPVDPVAPATDAAPVEPAAPATDAAPADTTTPAPADQ